MCAHQLLLGPGWGYEPQFINPLIHTGEEKPISCWSGGFKNGSWDLKCAFIDYILHFCKRICKQASFSVWFFCLKCIKLQQMFLFLFYCICALNLISSSNQVKDQGGRVAGSPARLQQDLEGAEREVLPQISWPSRHQLQTERHQSASIQVAAEWNWKHLWWGKCLSSIPL